MIILFFVGYSESNIHLLSDFLRILYGYVLNHGTSGSKGQAKTLEFSREERLRFWYC